AVGMAFTLGSIFPGMAESAHKLTRESASGRVMVSTLAPNNTAGIDAKVSPEVEAELAKVPGVARIDHDYFASMDDPRVGLMALGTHDGEPAQFHVLLGVDEGEAFRQQKGMIGSGFARELDL